MERVHRFRRLITYTESCWCPFTWWRHEMFDKEHCVKVYQLRLFLVTWKKISKRIFIICVGSMICRVGNRPSNSEAFFVALCTPLNLKIVFVPFFCVDTLFCYSSAVWISEIDNKIQRCCPLAHGICCGLGIFIKKTNYLKITVEKSSCYWRIVGSCIRFTPCCLDGSTNCKTLRPEKSLLVCETCGRTCSASLCVFGGFW